MAPRSSTGPTGFLFVLTLGSVSFFSGYRPSIFVTTIGWALLMLAIVSPFLFLLSLRADKLSWRVSLAIVGVMLATLVIVCFIPAWYFFAYVPNTTNPLYVGP
jgi:hypothetical protein